MKKSVLIVTILLLLSLVATTTATAKGDPNKMPTWEDVFDAPPSWGWYEADDTALEFKGRLYFKFFGDFVDQAWSTQDGENWSLAWEAPSIDPDFEYFWPMIVFENQLYLVLRDGEGVYADRIMRTPDGQSWETVAIAEGSENLWVWYGRFMSFDSRLYIFAGNWDGSNYSEHLWRSSSGDPGTWEDVAQFSCSMRAFTTFKGAMYMGSDWCDTGAQIWRSRDGENWEAVTTNGFNDPINIFTTSLVKHGGYFYVGIGGSDGGGDIWRTQDGMHWESVTTDGFEDPNNFMFTLINYKENLYAFSGSSQGVQVYRSRDGVYWNPANEPGWGDTGNFLVYDTAMVVFKGALYVSPEGPAGILKLVDP